MARGERPSPARWPVVGDTRSSSHSYSCWFSPAHPLRSYSGSRAAVFTSPLSPAAHRPFPLPGPPRALLYLQPLSLLFPTLREALCLLRARTHPRRSVKGPTAQTGTAEHCLASATPRPAKEVPSPNFVRTSWGGLISRLLSHSHLTAPRSEPRTLARSPDLR